MIGHVVHIPYIGFDILIPAGMNNNYISVCVFQFINQEWNLHIIVLVETGMHA